RTWPPNGRHGCRRRRRSVSGVLDVRVLVAGDLGSVTGPIGDVDRRGERDSGSRDRRDLLALGGRSVRPRGPGPTRVRRRRKVGSCEVVDVPECRVVLLPHHPQVRGGPNLAATQWASPPTGAGGLVEQDDLAR